MEWSLDPCVQQPHSVYWVLSQPTGVRVGGRAGTSTDGESSMCLALDRKSMVASFPPFYR